MPQVRFQFAMLKLQKQFQLQSAACLFELFRKIRDAVSEEVNIANILQAIKPIIKFTHNAKIPCQDCWFHTSHVRKCLVK